MNRSKSFMAAGSIILALAAIFATKANKQFSVVKTANFHNESYYYIYMEGSSFLQTSKTLLESQQLNMHIRTLGGTGPFGGLWTASGNTMVYFN